MKCIRVSDPEKFDEQVAQALQKSNEVFVLFFGRETSRGESWCSDCVVADPEVRAGLAKVAGSILLEVPIDRQSDTDSLTHIFRKRSDTRVERIPTLLRWTECGPSQDRLVEEQCREQNITSFVAETGKQRDQQSCA
ncbi:hypothetical protein GGH12_001702 [Coemansia sp. RSA 1822]|nr:hypothetical protein LPJ76_003828 [Coemansia sp. RSA 638]KAJ2122408.1 hypothetical protein IW147_003391 [Coemansia sp. RSA 720]KAJ2543597.1 hypothetical protein GGF49_001891 [Coemansia sp. RSA 1853]KAJ2565022.1 hypothetical protein GGH12_001702 [Coemansia sp. RSA 1822]